MEETVLWAVALVSGLLGLLLLAVAGVIAVYWNTAARRPREAASAASSQTQSGEITAAEKRRVPASSSTVRPAHTGGLWLWIKAWLFALFHASTVSVILGGITFFEDISRASEEIQNAGTVSFPKQLLPGALTGPVSQRRLSQPPEVKVEAE